MEETNKSLKKPKETKKNTIKQANQTVQTVKDLNTNIESINKIQTKGILEMENPESMNGNYRGKYNQQNTRDGRENLKC